MIEKIAYEGIQNCFRISNEMVELIVPTDRGPGILHFGFIGSKNVFTTVPEWGFTTHRLWYAPEAHPRSYITDKEPVKAEQNDKFIRLTKPTDKETGIQKEMDIPVAPQNRHITIIHRLYNRGLWPVELAPWAISAMAAGGKAIIPLPPRKKSTLQNLLPTSLMSIWEYSDLSDPRFKIAKRFITVGQDANANDPLKIGLMDTDGWAAYWTKETMFVKTFEYKDGAVYPDFGSSVEVYSGKTNLELETIAPLKLLQPGESAELVEQWYVFKTVPEPLTDADVDTIARHIPPQKMD